MRTQDIRRPSLLVLEVERADEEAVDVGDLLDGLGGGLPGTVAGLGVHAQHQRVRLKKRGGSQLSGVLIIGRV